MNGKKDRGDKEPELVEGGALQLLIMFLIGFFSGAASGSGLGFSDLDFFPAGASAAIFPAVCLVCAWAIYLRLAGQGCLAKMYSSLIGLVIGWAPAFAAAFWLADWLRRLFLPYAL